MGADGKRQVRVCPMLRSRQQPAMIGPLAAWLALLAAASVQAALPAPSSVSLRGWTKDGKSTAYESIIDGQFRSAAQNYYRFLIVTHSDGWTHHRYRMDTPT